MITHVHTIPTYQFLTDLYQSTEPVAIEPAIQNKDIGSYYVGETLLIGCPVRTCATGITVHFIFNESIIATGTPSSTDVQVYTMNLPITLDAAGVYTCMVTTEQPSYQIFQSFNVTGEWDSLSLFMTIVECGQQFIASQLSE